MLVVFLSCWVVCIYWHFLFKVLLIFPCSAVVVFTLPVHLSVRFCSGSGVFCKRFRIKQLFKITWSA